MACELKPADIEWSLNVYDYNGTYLSFTALVIWGVCEKWAYPVSLLAPTMSIAITAYIHSLIQASCGAMMEQAAHGSTRWNQPIAPWVDALNPAPASVIVKIMWSSA